MLSRDSRAEKKAKAIVRAQFALKQRLERVDFEEDVLIPLVNQLKAGGAILGLPEQSVFDIKVEIVDPNHDPAAGAAPRDSDPPPADARLRDGAPDADS